MGSRKPVRFTAPDVCPVCGDDVPRNSLACPGCGADERSGWREDVGIYGEDPSLETFDYDEFAKDEFGPRARPRGLSTFWWVAAIIVIVALCLLYARQGGL